MQKCNVVVKVNVYYLGFKIGFDGVRGWGVGIFGVYATNIMHPCYAPPPPPSTTSIHHLCSGWGSMGCVGGGGWEFSVCMLQTSCILAMHHHHLHPPPPSTTCVVDGVRWGAWVGGGGNFRCVCYKHHASLLCTTTTSIHHLCSGCRIWYVLLLST